MNISFIHSFTDQIFMRAYYASLILGTGNIEVNQGDKLSAAMEFTG